MAELNVGDTGGVAAKGLGPIPTDTTSAAENPCVVGLASRVIPEEDRAASRVQEVKGGHAALCPGSPLPPFPLEIRIPSTGFIWRLRGRRQTSLSLTQRHTVLDPDATSDMTTGAVRDAAAETGGCRGCQKIQTEEYRRRLLSGDFQHPGKRPKLLFSILTIAAPWATLLVRYGKSYETAEGIGSHEHLSSGFRGCGTTKTVWLQWGGERPL